MNASHITILLPFSHSLEHACIAHTHVPSLGGVRYGDKATRGRGRGRGRRTTSLTVPASGETESENGVFLLPGHPECLPFHYFTPFFFHMHIPPPPPPPPHTHTVPLSGGVHSVVKATRGRGGGCGRRTTALVVPPTEDPESVNGVFLQVSLESLPFHYFSPSLPLFLSLFHTHTGGVRSGDKATRGHGEVMVGEPLLLQFQPEGKLRVRTVRSSLQDASHFTILLSAFSTCTCMHVRAHTHTH